MMNPIQIIIQGTADFGRIKEEFEHLTKTSTSAFSAITNGIKGLELFAEIFAAKEIIGTLNEFSNEFVKSAKGAAQLEAALKSSHQASAEYSAQLEEQRRTIEQLTGVEEDQLIVVQRHLVQYKASKEQIEDLTKLSLDLAASQGMDTASAAMLLSRALGGEEVQLRGVRLEIDRTLPKYEQINSMIRQLNSQIGGQAHAALIASGTEITRLGNEWDQLKKKIGGVVQLVKETQAGTINRAIASYLAPYEFLARKFISNDTIELYKETFRQMLGIAAPAGQSDNAAEIEAQRMHDSRMQLIGLQTKAGLAAAGAPEQQAMLESDRAFNETRYALSQESLSKYLAVRLGLITREAEEEKKIVDAAIEANAEATTRKMAELSAVKEGTDLQQIEKVQQEYDKLLIEGKKLATQLTAIDTRTLTNLTNEELFKKQNPTSISGGVQKGWIDTVKALRTVYENLANTIKNTVGAAIEGVSHGITGLITGTQTWSQALNNIGTSVLNVVIDGLVKMFAAMVLGQEQATTAELAKQAATLPGALVKMLATAVGEGGWGAVAIIAAAVAALGAGVAAAAGAFAEGGRPEPGKPALVGERGPELWVPDTTGTIIPAHVTSRILNDRGSRSSGRARGRSERPQVIEMHAWFDKTEMTKHIRNSPDAQHAILEVVGKNQHMVLRNG